MVLFPNGLDDFSNPSGTSHMNDPTVLHSVQHSEVNDALEALERKVGIENSHVHTSLDYRITQTENELISISTSSIPYGSLIAWDEFLTIGSFTNGSSSQSGQTWHVSSADYNVVEKNKLELATATNGYLWIENIGPVGQLAFEFSFRNGSTENAKVIAHFTNVQAPADPTLHGLRFVFTATTWSVALWNSPSFPAPFASGTYTDISSSEIARVVIRRVSVQYIGITLPDGSMVNVFEPNSGAYDTYWQGTVLVGLEQPAGTFGTDRLPILHSYAAGGVWNMEAGPQGPGVPDGGSTGQFLVKLSNTNQDSGWVFPAGISVANDSIWTAAGQLVYATGTGHANTLNIGSAGQVLTVNGAADGFQYVSTQTSTFISDFTEAAQDAVGSMFAGDVQSGITVTYQDGTGKVDFTVTNAPQLQSQNGAFYLARTNHSGTQTASTISDFSEAVDDRVGALLQQAGGTTITYNDVANTVTISSVVYGGLGTDTVWVAAGDLIQGTGSGTAARLPRGGATNYLRVNAAGTSLEWSDFNEDVGDNIAQYVTGNTETGITVSYDDSVNKLNFVVTDAPQLQGQNGAYYLARANHSGSQAISTVTNLQSNLDLLAANLAVAPAPTGNTTTDRTNLQNMINAGIPFRLQAGEYKIASALTSVSGLVMVSSWNTKITQMTAGQHGLSGVDQTNITLYGFTLEGTSQSTGGTQDGINFTISSAAATTYLNIDIITDHWGRDGVSIQTPIISKLTCRTLHSGRHGRNFWSSGASDGTSCEISGFSAGNWGSGTRLKQMAYTVIHAGSADANGISYEIDTCLGITANACGSEESYDFSAHVAGSVGYAWKIVNSKIVLNSCYIVGNIGTSVLIQTGSVVVINVLSESSPGNTDSPTNSPTWAIDVESGAQVTAHRVTSVTPVRYAAGTTLRIPEDFGTIKSQNSNAVAITGGTITGITDLVVADGGTGASTFTAGYIKGNGTSALSGIATASVLGDIGGATSTHSHVNNINYETHTYALLGDGTTATIFTPHVVAKQAAETLQLFRATYRVSSGTPTVKLRNNGTDITGFTGMSVTATKASTTPTAVTLADLDELDMVCTAGSWTGFLYLTMTFTRTKTITSP